MTETLAHGYSSESTHREQTNEYQPDRVLDDFQKSLCPCALEECSLSIGRVKPELSVKSQLQNVCFCNRPCTLGKACQGTPP